jgi:hypothetical protein
MPIVGLPLVHSSARDVGPAAKPIGGALLGLADAYASVTEVVGEKDATRYREARWTIHSSGWRSGTVRPRCPELPRGGG